MPEGASPRTWNTDFNVGSVFTRDGLTSVYSFASGSVGPHGGGAAAGASPWVNPTGILANDGSFASIVVNTGVHLYITEFGFNIPATASITGISVQIKGYASASSVATLRLMKNGVEVGDPRAAVLTGTNQFLQVGSGLVDRWGTTWSPSDVNNASFGIALQATGTFHLATAYFDYAQITIGVASDPANFNWVGTFVDQNGAVKNIALDANGNLYVEDVTNNPGVLTLTLTGITPKSYVSGVNGQGVEFLAFNNLQTGSDVPRQYTSSWIDKISQVGPGLSPVFSASSSSSTTYPISTITQPAQQSWGFAFLLQSAAPGSNTPGNVVTVYYSDSTINPEPDQDLVNAFNSGYPVYVYCQFTPSTGGDTRGQLTSPIVALVTSVNIGKPNGQSRPFWYFTYQVADTNLVWNPGQNGAAVKYQRTLATLTTTRPVPDLVVGNNITITGNSVSAWNTTWPVTQTPNSGSMAITQTSLSASGVGTYSYNVVSGANPVAGQLVTVTGTLNGNGALNVTNVPIASVSGGSTGTFTVNLLPAGTNFPAEPEEGQATTSGTLFDIDPGAQVVGTGSDPIHGNGTGGTLTVSSAVQIGAGTRQGVCGFITRNGYWTAPSAPVVFNTPDNTTTINAANIPIGPPNTIGRYISFTEAGQNGVPGANFFVIPTDVTYYALTKSYTATATVIWDNTTTQASFSFIDDVLLNAEAIDVQGNNLFNLIEIGNPAWIVQYDSRNFYGLCQNKIQNFVNLSFDGGYLDPGNPLPLGWTTPDQYGSLLVSPVFGNSYYIKNTSGGSKIGAIGQISQTAYQDAYQQPIIQPNTKYSLRVTCRCPGGPTAGLLGVALSSQGVNYGGYNLALTAMTTTMATYSGPFLTAPFTTVPTTLQLSLYLAESSANADVEIDRVEIYPTEIPVLTTTVYGSYANDFESVDAVTGQVQFISENQQPVNGAVVMYDTFYALKDSSMYSLRSSPNLEPAQWDEPEVAQRAGACGVMAYDFGEQWIVSACRNGLYLYEGGQPGRIMPEIYQLWNAINWNAKDCIWVKNDVPNSRLFLGIPLPTPNFWMPDAPVNANPTTPNVILMCNYRGITSGEGIKGESAVHVTMFGTLEAGDMRRKWSLWTIPSPYASFVQTANDTQFYICNGQKNSKIYMLDPAASTDDGTAIDSLYTTYGFVNLSKQAQMPMLGWFRKRFGYLTMQLENAQPLALTFLGDTLLGPNDPTTGYNTWTVPGGFSAMSPAFRDRESTANFVAARTYLEFEGADFTLSGVTLYGRKDVWNVVTGRK